MAKVKGPLMSMDARGQIGKNLVFMGWKGIKDVRSYVVPANPNTTAQQAQRTIMQNAVASFHSWFFNTLDLDALRVLASIQAKVMSGFNVFCKLFIDYTLGSLTIATVRALSITSNTGGSVAYSMTAEQITGPNIRSGSSPTVMGVLGNPTHVAPGDPYTGTLGGLTVGSDVYFQFYTSTAGETFLSGIYKVRVLA